MTKYVAFLRAVNVGGTGKLPMSDLVDICRDAGFANPRTYIASGNALFRSDAAPTDVKALLEQKLEQYAGTPIPVFVRDMPQLAAILADNPYSTAPGNRVNISFLDAPPPSDALDHIKRQSDEAITLGLCEIYIHYPSGQGKSKLLLPAAQVGTARNINTVTKLLKLLEDL